MNQPATDAPRALVADTAARVLMEVYLENLCTLAGRKAWLGTRICWHLTGAASGRWAMNLRPNEVSVARTDEPPEAFDGHIVWALSLNDFSDFFRGEYRLAEALDSGRLQVLATDSVRIRLGRLFRAWAEVDLMTHLHDTERLPIVFVTNWKQKKVSRNAQTGVRLRAREQL
ncbi:MAG: hypothetical protein AAF658_19060 [Myxococcota bacterium]